MDTFVAEEAVAQTSSRVLKAKAPKDRYDKYENNCQDFVMNLGEKARWFGIAEAPAQSVGEKETASEKAKRYSCKSSSKPNSDPGCAGIISPW